MNRSFRKRINKEAADWDTIEQMDLVDITLNVLSNKSRMHILLKYTWKSVLG